MMKRKRLWFFVTGLPVVGLLWAMKSAASWRPQVFGVQKDAASLWLSGHDRLLVVSCFDGLNPFQVWDVASRKSLWKARGGDYPLNVSPDERVLAQAHAPYPIRGDLYQLKGVRFELHDALDGHLLRVLKPPIAQPNFQHGEELLDAGFSPDGREFRLATTARLLRWSVASGRALVNRKWPARNKGQALTSGEFLLNQEQLVAFDGTFVVFDARTGGLIRRLNTLHVAPDESMGVAPDGFSFYELSDNTKSRIFRLSDGRELWHSSNIPTFSARGELAFVATSVGINVFDAHTGAKLRALPGPKVEKGWAPSLAPSGDGNWLLNTDSHSDKLLIWRAR